MRKVLFMKGSELRLIEYMEGSKKRFIIPVYQRNYDWKIENCKQLYDDLIQVIKNNSKTHLQKFCNICFQPTLDFLCNHLCLSR